MPELNILPRNITLQAEPGSNLLEILRENNIFVQAPCGGNGTCGKCRVVVDGQERPACGVTVDRDLSVTVPVEEPLRILDTGMTPDAAGAGKTGYLLAVDIGTTSVVCYLLDGGRELARSSMANPQTVFGADVISRIRAALGGELPRLTGLIRDCVDSLVRTVCTEASVDPVEIGTVSVVGNPAMQQLFLGLSPENLAAVPFAPILTEAKRIQCGEILPICPRAELLIVPDLSGFIGADTMGCILSTGMYEKEAVTLLVDIGTNGEMVLGNKDRMAACSTAAGPALEGANIQCGMRAAKGAIDHVWLEDGQIHCSVIGGREAAGICGSGLIDAVAVCLDAGLLNSRGRIQNEERIIRLTERVFLTQDDIRQIQLAKGAIHAGILLMAQHLHLEIDDIQQVLLAGAFGSFLDPATACRMGLLPERLLGRIEAVGNAAGSGAKMLAVDDALLSLTQELMEWIEFLELAELPRFPRTFAGSMRFRGKE